MKQEEYINIGKVAGVYGLKGEIVLQHALGNTAFEDLRKIFIKDPGGSFMPWFVESVRVKSETEAYLKLEDIQTPEAAWPLLRKEIWFSSPDFKRYASKAAPISLLGYTVKDGKQVLGVIQEVIEQPHQVLCRLTVRGREVLIPLHAESLKKVDHQYKNITVKLPEGLLEVYLGAG
ncbi:ribosome maturation factor RimM [Niabella drilacis]|uniref:Ribosome maturation factor RimM n=1 Tax=Niabella drilacis (strain DSM 25811 / CCM 8410 / CCUG 62505 / LMG 26954 / E90) TaxID=1285928 RepID=A0A1G6NKX2_NIADE|nr:16S rRNA processing protein RimM [Niabella drilacis]SDC67936.1 16S rRNA processing protein RimM [Niabella drilacis]